MQTFFLVTNLFIKIIFNGKILDFFSFSSITSTDFLGEKKLQFFFLVTKLFIKIILKFIFNYFFKKKPWIMDSICQKWMTKKMQMAPPNVKINFPKFSQLINSIGPHGVPLVQTWILHAKRRVKALAHLNQFCFKFSSSFSLQFCWSLVGISLLLFFSTVLKLFF